MNRLKKAFSLDRGDSRVERPSKRFSLLSYNKQQQQQQQQQQQRPVNSLNEMTSTSNVYRPRSVHFDTESIKSFITTTTIESHTHHQSAQTFSSDILVPPPRRRSRNFPTKSSSIASEQKELTENEDSYLQLGMKYHEKGELEKSTHYWRLAAESESPLGLFFYGIALRHGWGCKKNPTEAVKYLQTAAECAVYDLQTGIAQTASIAKSELVLAIYELGVCFRHGWGVPKDLETAAYYFQIASNLGDPDAQNDLGFCYAQGLGVKKDRYFAAKYYRLAEKQGQGIIGNSWIWKEKYNQVEEPGWKGRVKK